MFPHVVAARRPRTCWLSVCELGVRWLGVRWLGARCLGLRWLGVCRLGLRWLGVDLWAAGRRRLHNALAKWTKVHDQPVWRSRPTCS